MAIDPDVQAALDQLIADRIQPLEDWRTDAAGELADHEDRIKALEQPASPDTSTTTVTETFPANPDVILNPGDPVQPQLVAGSIVELKPGSYGDQPLGPATGVHLFSRGQAVFTRVGSAHRFIDSGGHDVTLQGVRATGYGIADAKERAAIELPGDNWKLIDVEVDHSPMNGVRLNKGGHNLTRVWMHDCARYGWQGGNRSTLTDCKVTRIGARGDMGSPDIDSNRGVCKMPGGSTGMIVKNLLAEDIDGAGLWWDGASDGVADGVTVRRCWGNGVAVEVSYGGFRISNVHVEDGADPASGSLNYPIKAAVLISASPNVVVDGVYGRNVGTGVGIIYNSTHSVFTNGIASVGMTADQAKQILVCDGERISNVDVDGLGRYGAGWTGGQGGDIIFSGANSWGRMADGTPTKFRWENQFPIDEATFMTLAG